MLQLGVSRHKISLSDRPFCFSGQSPVGHVAYDEDRDDEPGVSRAMQVLIELAVRSLRSQVARTQRGLPI